MKNLLPLLATVLSLGLIFQSPIALATENEQQPIQLTTDQKSQLSQLYKEKLATEEKILNKLVEFKAVPEEVAKQMLQRKKDHYQKLEENNFQMHAMHCITNKNKPRF